MTLEWHYSSNKSLEYGLRYLEVLNEGLNLYPLKTSRSKVLNEVNIFTGIIIFFDFDKLKYNVKHKNNKLYC